MLAVCAKLNLEQCVQMVADAYSAVPLICTDGLKLLMFVKFITVAISILHDQGNILTITTSKRNVIIKSSFQAIYLMLLKVLTINFVKLYKVGI